MCRRCAGAAAAAGPVTGATLSWSTGKVSLGTVRALRLCTRAGPGRMSATAIGAAYANTRLAPPAAISTRLILRVRRAISPKSEPRAPGAA